jgi:hypothetical protein
MNKLAYLIIFFHISFLCTFCSKKQNPPFDESLINLICEEPEFPPYATCLFFVQSENNKILLLNYRELKEIYNESFFSIDYRKFIKKALNQQLTVKSTNTRRTFELNKNVMDVYLNNSFNDFLTVYCENSNGKYSIKNNVPENQMTTIFYYAFINNYLTESDDYSGKDVLFSTSVCSNNNKYEN